MNRLLLIFLATLLLLAWGFWSDLSYDVASFWTIGASPDQIERAGQWGDSFGAFNALVSAAAFATVAATIMLQSRALSLQSKALQNQATDIHRERFESSFLELLRLTRELRKEVTFGFSAEYVSEKSAEKSLSYRNALRKKRTDIDAFRSASLEMVFWIRKLHNPSNPDAKDIIDIYMRRVHSKNEATLGRYFRIIYTILYRLHNDKILTQDEKIRYSNLLRSQLSSYEISLLAANGLCPISKDLKFYIIQFRMLKYMNGSANRKRYMPLYGDETFAERD